ncbi:MAG: acyl-CoA carboxylase subunit epsilon [Actinomycetota bacterium]|nr:acyl-CoA carboxylase subunit epsilon [Actinomycetota bacterium]
MSEKQCYSTQCHSRVIHIVGGEPSDEELAALVAVLAELASAAGPGPPKQPSAWADPARRLRTPLQPGPGAWRAWARPR